MDKVIIFGATDTGQQIYKDCKEQVEVIAFVDEDEKKWQTEIFNIPVYNPEDICEMKFDYIYVGVLTYYHEVVAKLLRMGIARNKIDGKYVELPIYSRIECMKSVRKLLDEKEIGQGAVAELGVFQGEFAKEINKVFYDRKLYLFDTFEGFHSIDCQIEISKGYSCKNKTGYFSNTNVDVVLSKMTYPENCQVCKGYFPESVVNIEDEFCFVNLDADLYAPTLAGLEYFYPRLIKGGVIFVHDYFSLAFTGAREAVQEFCDQNRISYMPIGDSLSIAIMK